MIRSMIKKQTNVEEIVAFLGSEVLKVTGDYQSRTIDNITDAARVSDTSLDWVNPSREDRQSIAESSKAKVLLVDQTVEMTELMKKDGKILIYVNNPKTTLMKISRRFFVSKPSPGVDPSAFIHPNAKIGKNNYIGPNCYIGECVIGDNNIIHSNVCIYDRTTIGDNNVIHSGALICVDGLGCERDEEGLLDEFPQLGGVIIGSNCYIGGNTHIASGSLADTIIENGCKINGMCFIGSNDHLHENVWITGSTMLTGTVEVGKNTTIFSRVVAREWIKIGERVTIGMGSVVTKNVPDGETWFGSPAKKRE